jgi:type I restriction enzyme S subunit
MKLETFFEKFERFADAPNAIEKLRELVLRLAMQGKLSEAQDRDAPVSVLLRDVEAEKNGLGIKNSANLSTEDAESLEAETSYAIPARWTWVRFGDIARHNAGKTLDKGRNSGKLRDYITTSNLYWGYFRLDDVRKMPIQDDELERCTAVKGDLLICEGGEAGRAAVWPHDYEISFQNHVHRARFYGGVNPYFVQRYFEALNVTGEIDKFRKGVGISNMSGKALASIVLPLPPLAEQKRIVARVDELMALCDRLEAQQQEREVRHVALARASLARFADTPVPDNLNLLFHPAYNITATDLRKSILTLAVRGKLVSQDSHDETAEVVAVRIMEQRERLIEAKQLRRSQLVGPIENGPFDIPKTWKWMYLGDAMLNVTDGFHSTPKAIESGVRYVTAKHVKPGLIDFDACLYVSEDDFKEISSKTRQKRGDVLVVNIGAGCGLASIIEVDFEFAFKNVAILNRPNEVDSKYLFNYLVSRRDEIFEERTKGGAQPFLSLGLIRQIPFPVPPLAEQRRIVAKVDELMTLVDQLEAQLATAGSDASGLLNAAVSELISA